MMERVTYLARVPSEMYERRYQRFTVNRSGQIAYLERNLGGLKKINVKVLDMSIGGAGLELSVPIKLPQHYYLSIAGFPNRFGCAQVHRNGSRIGIKFLAKINEDLLSEIVRADFRAGLVRLR